MVKARIIEMVGLIRTVIVVVLKEEIDVYLCSFSLTQYGFVIARWINFHYRRKGSNK